MQDSWYLVCQSKQLPKGKVIPFLIEPLELVIFRNGQNQVVALDGVCDHLGAKLKRAKWSQEGIICPLHNICFDSLGNSKHSSIGRYRQKKFQTKEMYGSVFVYIGKKEHPAFPNISLLKESEQIYQSFKPITVSTHWISILVNAFDPIHLEHVHRRKLVEPPKITLHKKDKTLEFLYVSRVIGNSNADKLMKWISNDLIQVRIRCHHGLTYTIESDLGKTKSCLLLSLKPLGEQTSISGILVQKKSLPFFDWIRLQIAHYLFRKFLLSDLLPLEGMKVNLTHLNHHPILRTVNKYIKIL